MQIRRFEQSESDVALTAASLRGTFKPMRAAVALLLVCLPVAAQDLPVVRGVLVRREASVLTVRDPGNLLLRYGFDSHTYVERDNRPIEAWELRPGDRLEVVSEAVPGMPMRAARSIHVISPGPVERHRAAAVEALPTGDRSYSGLILRVTPTSLILHLRQGGDQEILLRPDTRCLENGEIVSTAALAPHMRVFIRAGANVSGKPEAYQVLWGSMLDPK